MRLFLIVFVAVAALFEEAAAQAVSKDTAPARERVILVEEHPPDPAGRRFVGTAIWRTEAVRPSPGQTPQLAIRAEIDVPDAALAMTWTLRRNTDSALPASHVIDITFKPSGRVSNVPGILTRRSEEVRGPPLAALVVRTAPDVFLTGLSGVDADRRRNLEMLRESAWFDIPLVYKDGRRANLIIAKGASGVRAFKEAFAAWKERGR